MTIDRSPMPRDLRLLVRHGVDEANAYLWEVNRYSTDLPDWRRMALIRLTDAIDRLKLTAGSMAVYLQIVTGLSEDRIATYLQVKEEDLSQWMTPTARAYAFGLLGLESHDDRNHLIHSFGHGLVQGGGLREPQREANLDVMLAAVYANHYGDPEALDYLPEDLRKKARRIIDILAEEPVVA